MNTAQIVKCLRQDLYMREHCLGCFALDQLPRPTKVPFGLVVNSDPSTEEGTHWLAVWVDAQGQGHYFDSYGQKALPVIERYLDKYSRSWSLVLTAPLQAHLTAVCGQYCVYFLYLKCRNYQFVPISDVQVNDFVERKFSLDLDVIDIDLIVKQVCKVFE